MLKTLITVPVLLALAVAALLAPAEAPAEEETFDLVRLDFLAGTWRSEEEEGSVWEEHWFPAAGDNLVGMTRWTVNGRIRLYELAAIERDDEGVRFTLRHFGAGLDAGDEPPMVFRLTGATADRAEFTSEYEFPRTLVYAKTEEGNLTATLAGTRNGEERRMGFTFRAVRAR